MKKIFVGLVSLFLFFLNAAVTHSQGEFTTDSSIYYQVNNDGTTEVTHYITLTNNFTDYYATNYALTLRNIKPATVIAFQGQSTLPHTIEKKEEETYSIVINFPDTVVGQGAKREFSIRYTDATVAQKTGEVWEVSVPRLADSSAFGKYSVTLSVPSIFGELAYVSPTPREEKLEQSRHIITFDKEAMLQSSVVAAFGRFQVFTFDLTYHLENPLNRRSSIELAVPPDTAYQKVILQEMHPKPISINKDEDGNWLAYYILNPRERVDVRAKGAVQIFAESIPFSRPSQAILEKNKAASPVWQINDPAIVALADELKTPEAIYNFVTQTLEYDFERAKPNVARLGASEALKNPKMAICMEFTDLFVALARAAGIPAREVNGFAYTENPESEPLSLVADVLHAWPEYWDEKRGIWVPVDPTWGSTAREDYFHKLDLRHFAFVHHGQDHQLPYPPGSYKLGPEPQKDIFVMFGQLPVERDPDPVLQIKEVSSPLFKDMKVFAEVKNNGVTTLPRATVNIYFDNELIITQQISELPPLGVVEVPVTVPFNLLARDMPDKVSIEMLDQNLAVATHKESIMILNISVVFLLIFLILLFTIVRIRRIRFNKLHNALTNARNTFSKRFSAK